jgi:hypothetical protein
MVDDITITDITQFTEMICLKQLTGQLHLKNQFANPRWSAMSGDGLPTLHFFNQLNIITHHLNAINNDGTTWNDPITCPPLIMTTSLWPSIRVLLSPSWLDKDSLTH